MIEILKRADAFIQRHFDACVHWVMLTFGVSKGFVRYALGLLNLGGSAMTGWLFGWGTWWILAAVIGLASVEICRRRDDAADEAGCLSENDSERCWAVFKLADWAALAVLATACLCIPHAKFVAAAGATATNLCLEYMKNTNPRPPEKRQRALAPQPEAA